MIDMRFIYGLARDFKWVTGESFEKMRFQKKNHIDFFSKSGKKKISKLSYTLRSIYKRESASEKKKKKKIHDPAK
jgi:hypothetical protein